MGVSDLRSSRSTGEKEALQRYWLLRILMDTAVKISCMTFESIASAVERLRQIA